TAGQVSTTGDIAPLIAAADLQGAVVTMVKLRKVVGLQQHIGEFSKGNTFTFTLNALLDRLFINHVIDGKVLADIAQEGEHIHIANPVQIVDDFRRYIARIKANKPADLPF